MQAIEVASSPELDAVLVQTGRRTATTTESSVGEILTDEERAAAAEVAAFPAEAWFELSNWAKETGQLKPFQRSLAYSLGRNAINGKPNSRKQSVQGRLSWPTPTGWASHQDWEST